MTMYIGIMFSKMHLHDINVAIKESNVFHSNLQSPGTIPRVPLRLRDMSSISGQSRWRIPTCKAFPARVGHSWITIPPTRTPVEAVLAESPPC